MSRTVSDLKDSVSAQLSGLDINQVDDLFPCFERAARVFVQRAKIPETQVKQQLTIYNGVTDYLADERIFSQGLIDIQPQGIRRDKNDFVYLRMQDDFDRTKEWHGRGTKATFDYNNGTPVIRIVSSYTPQQIILDSMTSLSGWTNDGVYAIGLAVDSSFYYQQPGALRFNLSASGATGYITENITPIDLTSYKGVGVCFLAVSIPDAIAITSIGIKIGSDVSNYYNVSNTVSILGAFISNGFMLIPLDLSKATTVGSPVVNKISYLQIFINYNGVSQTNIRMGALWISLPTPVTVIYSAAALFLATGQSAISNSITNESDVIVLNDAGYTIFEMECAKAVLRQAGGAAADSAIGQIDADLNSTYTRTGKLMVEGLYDQYKAENPSQVLRTTGSYYDTGNSYNDSRL